MLGPSLGYKGVDELLQTGLGSLGFALSQLGARRGLSGAGRRDTVKLPMTTA